MPADPGPFDLDTMRLIMDPRGMTTTKPATPAFYQELDDEFDGFAGHTLISRHEFEDDWGVWEMHPEGDEFVYLLSGDIDFVLWTAETGERTVRVHEPGSYIIVPKGAWHTARPRTRTAMLFVTPGEGTRHAETLEAVTRAT